MELALLLQLGIAILLLAVAVALVLRWVALMGAMHVARWFVDLTIPDTRDFLRQSFTIAAIWTAVSLVPVPFGGLLGVLVTAGLLRKWFDAEMPAVWVVALLTAGAEWLVVLAIEGLVRVWTG